MEKAIELISVSKEYPGVKAVDQISFCVTKRTIHGFLGPNGAGKSTTMKMLAGILKPNSGKISILGRSMDKKSAEAKKLIGYLPEIPPLYPNMTVESYLRFVASINGVKKTDVKKQVEKSMEKTGLIAMRKRVIEKLSKGYKQRVGIASAIVFDPQVVILDEPTVGLDPHSIEEIRKLILTLKEEATVLLSTHQLYEAHLLCDEVTIINGGRIVQSGNLKQMQKSFQTRQVIQATVGHWSDDLKQKLEQLDNIESCDVSYVENHIALKIFASSLHDSRALISAFLVENHCSLLELHEVQLDLQDIFKLATTGEVN